MKVLPDRPPALDKLLDSPALRDLISVHGRASVLSCARHALEAWRANATAPFDIAQFEQRCGADLYGQSLKRR